VHNGTHGEPPNLHPFVEGGPEGHHAPDAVARHAVIRAEIDRFASVRRVLWRVLWLNLLVAGAKLAYGIATGAISIVADGIHSLLDSSSNVIGLLGANMASRPPDPSHPYGHRKFEVLAALGITFLLGLACYEILVRSLKRLLQPEAPVVNAASFAIMIATMIVNGLVSRYERRRGAALRSSVLVADALHTRSDVYASAAVIAGLAGVRLEIPWLDPAAALVVVAFIVAAGYRIVASSLNALADARVYQPEEIAAAAMGVPGVIDCHGVRTRGLPDHALLDFHLTVAAETPTDEAHAISHRVVEAIQQRFPGIRDVTPHVEPAPPGPAAGRAAGPGGKAAAATPRADEGSR
jgi:cation diffusion facilitator family transporter